MSAANLSSFDGLSESQPSFAAVFEDSPLEICHWNGKSFFESILVNNIANESCRSDSVSDLEARLHDIRTEFPYGKQLDLLAYRLSFAVMSTIDIRCDNKHQAYLTVAGMVLQRGDTTDKALFTNELEKQLRKSMTAEHTMPNASDAGRPSHASTSSTDSLPDRDMSEAMKLRRSLKALNERGDRDGIYPEFEEGTKLTDEPPCFLVGMMFKGKRFEACGRTKKLAKQAVALEACDTMGISVM